MRSLRDAEVEGKRVLMRVDFNVPTDQEGHIIDDTKMRAALPTIEYILSHQGRLVLMSHLGRPKGKPEDIYSLKEVGEQLSRLLNRQVIMADDSIGPEVQKQTQALKPGQVMLLENLRFYPGEEKNDPEHARQLAQLGDIYINDAFGTAHRAHASTVGVAEYLPAYAGFLMEKEVEMLKKVLDSPQSPRLAIMGGAKVADKLGLIENLLEKLDVILIGGGMANTFLKADGKQVGKSLVENDLLIEASRLLKRLQKRANAFCSRWTRW